jgi:hypothetical protein
MPLSGWGETLREILKLGAAHLFRRRPAAGLLLAAGTALLLAAASGWGVSFDHQGADGRTSFRFTTGEGTPAAVTYLLAALGGALLLAAAAMLLAVARQELRERQAAAEERDRRRVVVIEQRGLHSRLDSPMADAVPAAIEGRRVPVVLDHGTIAATGEADRVRLMDDAKRLRRDVRMALGDTPPGLTTIVYGGLAPVPMTFLAGGILDDEGAVTVMDWDRTAGRWRLLDGADDGERFVPADLGEVRPGTNEVMLAVSVSYGADLDGVVAVSDGNPVVALRVPSPRIGNHWSGEKQKALADEFLTTIGRLQDLGVARIHLFLAAPNSVVFRFGKHYDRRNMPEVIVYQFERSGAWRFPWGIRMPHHGQPEPELVINDLYPPVVETSG